MRPITKIIDALIFDIVLLVLFSVDESSSMSYSNESFDEWGIKVCFVGVFVFLALLINTCAQKNKSSSASNSADSDQEYNQDVRAYNNKVQNYNKSIDPWLEPVNQYPRAEPGSKVTTTYEKNVQNSAGAADLKVQDSTNPNGSTKHESRFMGSTVQNGRIKHTYQHTVTTSRAIAGRGAASQYFYIDKKGQRVPLHKVHTASQPYSSLSSGRVISGNNTQGNNLGYTKQEYPVYEPNHGGVRKQ